MCVLSLPSAHSFSPSCYTLSLSFLSPSSSLLIPLSDEQIELLNELFLWAPNAHPKLSICSFPPSVRLLLPPSHHPPPPNRTSYPATMLKSQEAARFHEYADKNTKQGCAKFATFESFN